MSNTPWANLALIDTSGFIIIAAIALCLIGALIITAVSFAHYRQLGKELSEHHGSGRDPNDASRVLSGVVRDIQSAAARDPRAVNTQAVIESAFQSELGGLLMGERFVKAAPGLMIVLGLVGTFYGLTLSIGKLVTLVGGDATSSAEVTQALVQGLTGGLSGMAVAFLTSLVGIASAIVATVLGICCNVPDRRAAFMTDLERFLDHEVVGRVPTDAQPASAGEAQERLERCVSEFAQSVGELQQTVGHFDGALERFSSSTRDFKDFNLHLRDNVQRLSLCFGDLSESLQKQVGALTRRVES